jgi:hypothetical protein
MEVNLGTELQLVDADEVVVEDVVFPAVFELYLLFNLEVWVESLLLLGDGKLDGRVKVVESSHVRIENEVNSGSFVEREKRLDSSNCS